MRFVETYVNAFFRTTEDGRKLFSPWGVFGRGYAVPSEEELRLLRRGLEFALIAPFPFLVVAFVWQGVVGVAAIAALFFAAWACWVRIACRGYDLAGERLTFRENLASQADLHSTRTLWILETVALAFVAAAFVDLVFDTSDWLQDLALVCLSGACALVFARLLIEKRRGVVL